MELKGLKALFLGDSITEGSGASAPERAYWRVLGELTGMETVGYGVGGTRIARQIRKSENARWDMDFNTRANEMDPQADIVCVFGGTNDYGHGFAPIGRPEDVDAYSFYGALNRLYTKLLKAYPEAFIFVITPTHRLNENCLRGDGYKPEMLPLKGYVDIIREVAEKYSLPVLDLYANYGVNPCVPEMQARFMPDGLHPNDAGHRRIAQMIESFLQANYRR